MIDLLANLKEGKITLDQAYDLFDQAVTDFHMGILKIPWPQELGLDEYESSAKLQGATLEDLVKLRYQGWPKTCCLCKQLIEYKDFGWIIRHKKEGLCLEHINCPITT
jgi:hypothetical protein